MNEEFESLDAIWSVATLRASAVDALSAIPVGASLGGRDILAGVGSDRAKHVLFPVSAVATVEEDRGSAGVQLRERVLTLAGEKQRFLSLGCSMPWLDLAFSDIASECIRRVIASVAARPDLVIHGVLEEWRELLAKKTQDGMSEEAVLGLIGELDTLAELASFDPGGAVAAWTGPSGGLHDFRNGPLALEVKTSRRRHGRTLTINGVEQLLAPPDATLFLRFVRVEVVPGGQVTLHRLLENLRTVGVVLPVLSTALAKLGLQAGDLGQYDHIAVDIVERRTYRINESFPRIVPASFAVGHLPQGVVGIQYSIELAQEPPDPIDDAALKQLCEGLVA